MDDAGEGALLAWLCTHLPELAEAAERDGWRPRLDSAVGALRSGTSVQEVCRRLGLGDVDAVSRSGTAPGHWPSPASLRDLNLAPVESSGDYLCPHGQCDRLGRPDRHGREPLCVDGRPMSLTPPRSRP